MAAPQASERNEPVLAFDCAGTACAAALWSEGRVLAHRSERRSRGQAERLLPLLEETLAEARIGWGDVQRLAVTRGPGSFTGVRIGLATARALALASGYPLFALDGFSLYAAMVKERIDAAAWGGRRLLVAIDARRADVFVQTFDAEGNPVGEPHARLPGALAEELADEPLLLAGDGAAQLGPLLTGRDIELVADCDMADTRTLARWATGQPLAKTPSPPAPLYLRPPDVTLGKARQ